MGSWMYRMGLSTLSRVPNVVKPEHLLFKYFYESAELLLLVPDRILLWERTNKIFLV
jgi:hypothetical protein